MGQSASAPSHTDTSARRRWEAGRRAEELRGSRGKRGGEDRSRNPMKSDALSCLGRRKRESSRAGAARESEGGEPTSLRGHRAGKLPRDEPGSTPAGRRVLPGGSEASPGPDAEEIRPAVGSGTAAGPSDAPGSGTLSAEVSPAAGGEEPEHSREDDAWGPPTGAMVDQPPGRNSRDGVASAAGGLAGAAPGPGCSSASDQHLAENLEKNERAERKMTRTDRAGVPPSPGAPGGPCEQTERRGSTGQASLGPPAGQSYPGTIPKLIITRDPSPTPSPEPPALLSARTELPAGLCLDSHGEDESPCSDSGCGGSPALTRSPRKLSNSSSLGLSSASSFEESEDDFTGSDIESSLSPARSLCSPDEGPGVSPPTSHYTQQHRS
ncbi:unnamed protein product [Tetraodon nigroviridis]|uniref:(spotted green pufferfish) hypothetical protein n=1 Tax=Tetraodon nigroviridis TaxID=99883 RepID=Q4SPL1_TETNG|nr:unnamed protein product [Tetraodon nigroviridis]